MVLAILSAAIVIGGYAICVLAVELLREAEAERLELAARGRRCGLNPRS